MSLLEVSTQTTDHNKQTASSFQVKDETSNNITLQRGLSSGETVPLVVYLSTGCKNKNKIISGISDTFYSIEEDYYIRLKTPTILYSYSVFISSCNLGKIFGYKFNNVTSIHVNFLFLLPSWVSDLHRSPQQPSSCTRKLPGFS